MVRAMVNYVGINGRCRPYDEDTEYLYIGRYTADFPSHWEAKVRRDDDHFRDVLKEFRVELSGPLVDIKTDLSTLRALVAGAIEDAIQGWVSSGAVTNWINWHSLMNADEKSEVQ
jgi:hypothetical protein